MNRQDRAYDYEILLSQTVGINHSLLTLSVLNKILDEAIAVLEPWKNKIPRGMSESARKRYLEKDVDISWNLRNPNDACKFNLSAKDFLPAPIRQAALLARLCTGMIEDGTIQKHGIRSIINAYRCLDKAENKNDVIRANKGRTDKYLSNYSDPLALGSLGTESPARL